MPNHVQVSSRAKLEHNKSYTQSSHAQGILKLQAMELHTCKLSIEESGALPENKQM